MKISVWIGFIFCAALSVEGNRRGNRQQRNKSPGRKWNRWDDYYDDYYYDDYYEDEYYDDDYYEHDYYDDEYYDDNNYDDDDHDDDEDYDGSGGFSN